MYSAWLCFLAACAVIPSPPEASRPVEPAAVAITPEVELARVVREKAEISARFGAGHPEMRKAEAVESVLRQTAQAEDREASRRALILALSQELADALQNRREIAARSTQADPELRVAQGVVLALTAAINREVRSAG
jgi:hypothetical protein